MKADKKSRIFAIELEEQNTKKSSGIKIFLFYLPLSILLIAIFSIAGYYVYENGLPWLEKWQKPQDAKQISQSQSLEEQEVFAQIAMPLTKEVPQHEQLQKAIEYYQRGYNSQAQIELDEIINSSAPAEVKSFAHVYAGILADQEDRFQLALDHYQRALKLYEQNFYAHYNSAITLQKKGEIDLALQALQKAQRLRPDRKDVVILQGQLEYQRQDFQKAKQILQTAKQEPHALYNIGLVYKKEGQLAEAKASFLKALELSVTGDVAVQSAAQLGILSAGQGDYQNAEIYFQKAIVLSPANGRYYYNLALVQYHLNRPQQAVKNLEQAVSLGAGNHKTFLYIASLYNRMGMHKRSQQAIYEGLQIAPMDMELLGQLSDLQIAQHQWTEALATLEKMDSLATGILEKSKVLYNLGKVYAQMRDFEKAQNYLERAYQLDSSNEDALIALGNIHQQNNEAHKSIQLYKEALRINPDNRKVLRQLAQTYQDLGLTAEAENALKKLSQHPLRSENDIYYTNNQLGIIYKNRKAYDTAIQYFEKTFRAQDEHLRYQAFLQAADTSLLADKPSDTALGYLEKAVAMRPQDNSARLLLVKAYLKDGSARANERAEEEAITVIETEDNSALLSKSFTFRGIIYYRQGLFERALDMFNRALELDPSNEEAFANKQAASSKI